MLVELVVENYAVMERLRVRFHRGLNLLTGETGSGKSIVVDALGLLFGGRASADMVRSGAERARISGIFEIPPDPMLRALLEDSGIAPEDGEMLLEREVLANGKSRAFAGSRPVTAGLLRDLAPHLGDIHGQHDQQRLFSADAQREMLDEFAANQDLLAATGTAFRSLRECVRELDELERAEQERLRLADLWNFQRKEIEAAGLAAGEDAALNQERRVLQNVAKLQEAAGAAYEALYEAPESALTAVRSAMRRLEELCRIDPSIEPVLTSLQPASIAIEEASHELRHYLGGLEADPGRLEEVEGRLATLEKLKRKYGQSIDEILGFLEEVRGQLEAVETAGERRVELERQRVELASAYESAAARLSASRREAARKLEKRIETELASLAMAKAVFRVVLEPAAPSDSGSESVKFLISTNPGEEPRALEKVASGGELSRIALALKTCIAVAPRSARAGLSAPRTLVFDEVDAGIGGGAAETVGRRLKSLAANHQVLCVTHLAQIAGFGDHHYVVEKHENSGRTIAAIEELTGDARVREIGRMLSGHRLTPEALKHAEQLIQSGTRA
jgi:DNA repair protein RecN (Recombination protein N)